VVSVSGYHTKIVTSDTGQELSLLLLFAGGVQENCIANTVQVNNKLTPDFI